MLSEDQRARILAGLANVTALPVTPIATSYMMQWVPQPPDVVFEVTSQGVSQQGYMDLMRDWFDGISWHEWHGHISRATIKLTIEIADAKDLEEATYSIYSNLWKYEAGLSREESPEGDYLLFRGCDPPKFMPPYNKDQSWPLRSVIEYFVDYFDTVESTAAPIEEIEMEIMDGVSLVVTWQEKFYTLDAKIVNPGVQFYTLDAILETGDE